MNPSISKAIYQLLVALKGAGVNGRPVIYLESEEDVTRAEQSVACECHLGARPFIARPVSMSLVSFEVQGVKVSSHQYVEAAKWDVARLESQNARMAAALDRIFTWRYLSPGVHCSKKVLSAPLHPRFGGSVWGGRYVNLARRIARDALIGPKIEGDYTEFDGILHRLIAESDGVKANSFFEYELLDRNMELFHAAVKVGGDEARRDAHRTFMIDCRLEALLMSGKITQCAVRGWIDNKSKEE